MRCSDNRSSAIILIRQNQKLTFSCVYPPFFEGREWILPPHSKRKTSPFTHSIFLQVASECESIPLCASPGNGETKMKAASVFWGELIFDVSCSRTRGVGTSNLWMFSFKRTGTTLAPCEALLWVIQEWNANVYAVRLRQLGNLVATVEVYELM